MVFTCSIRKILNNFPPCKKLTGSQKRKYTTPTALRPVSYKQQLWITPVEEEIQELIPVKTEPRDIQAALQYLQCWSFLSSTSFPRCHIHIQLFTSTQSANPPCCPYTSHALTPADDQALPTWGELWGGVPVWRPGMGRLPWGQMGLKQIKVSEVETIGYQCGNCGKICKFREIYSRDILLTSTQRAAQFTMCILLEDLQEQEQSWPAQIRIQNKF